MNNKDSYIKAFIDGAIGGVVLVTFFTLVLTPIALAGFHDNLLYLGLLFITLPVGIGLMYASLKSK